MRPLGLPGDGDLDGPTTAPAVEMLVQCVRRFDPEFDRDAGQPRGARRDLCPARRTAAGDWSWPPHASSSSHPGELTFRLRHRLSILINTARDVPRRHRTLRAALAWSHDLLKPDERAAFRRLSVFVGGATLDAAGEVCDLDDPVATISSLVDKSLLHRRIRPDGATEFVMLESLREYAAELLCEHGEEEAVTARHARYFADLAVLVETAIGGPAEAPWVDSVGFAQGNLRKALAHATAAADAGLSLPLGSALGWYAYTRGTARGRPGDPGPRARRRPRRSAACSGRLAHPRPADRRRTGARTRRSRRRGHPAHPRAGGRRRPAEHGNSQGVPRPRGRGPWPHDQAVGHHARAAEPVLRARQHARCRLVTLRPRVAGPSPGRRGRRGGPPAGEPDRGSGRWVTRARWRARPGHC